MKGVTSLISALLIAVSLSGCGGDKPTDKLLDKNAMVYVNVQDGKTTRAVNPDLPDNPAHLAPKELVAQAETMIYDDPKDIETTMWLGALIKEGDPLTTMGRKAGEYQYKLLDEAKFVFWGDFVIGTNYKTNEPKLEEEFFKATNVRFYDKADNIIGYIPQRVLKDAWERIQKHFAAKEYDKVYQIFRETYQAYPCTTEEWNKLKAEGRN